MANEPLVLQVGADASKLEAAFERSLHNFSKTMDAYEARANGAEKRINNALKGIGRGSSLSGGGADVGKALDKVFDSSRLAVLDAGAARLRVFGSALEPLGPWGLAAAAALVAMGAAVAEAKGFTDLAADIAAASKQLGISTTRVQEYDHVLTELGVPIEEGRKSLAGLEKALGNVETGAARAQSLRVFTGLLHIDAEDLRSWGTIDQQIQHVLGAVSKLSTEGRAVASKVLRMDPGVLNSLVDGRDKFSELAAEAHKYGLVIDADVIRKGAEANAKLKTAAEIIDTNLKVAFADLAPVIVSVANAIAGATRNLNDFIQSFKQLQDRNSGALENERQNLQDDIAGSQNRRGYNAYPGTDVNAVEDQRVANDRSQISGLNTLIAARAANDALKNATAPSNDPHIPGPPHKIHDDSANVTKDVADRYAEAQKSLNDALAQLTGDVTTRADLEKAAIEDELTRQLTDLDASTKKISADKSISGALQTRLLAENELTKEAVIAAADAKQQRIDRDTENRLIQDAIALRQKVNAYYSEAAGIAAQLAPTRSGRDGIERQNLAKNQQIDRSDLTDAHNERLGGLTSQQDIDAENGDFRQLMAGLLALQAAQRDQLAAKNAGPLAKFAQGAPTSIGQFGEQAGDQVQSRAVAAMDTLNTGLAEAITQGKGLKDVLKSALASFEEGILKDLLEDSEKAAIHALIPGFAAGTGSAPGGLALVGERGPELVNLPRGSQVMPNHQLRGLPGYADGIGSFAPVERGSASRGGTINISHTTLNDLRGTTTDGELDRRLALSEARTKSGVMSAVHDAMPGWNAQYQSEYGH